MLRCLWAILLVLILCTLPAAYAQPAAAPRPLTPFVPRFGNGCQTQGICAAIERLGLYAGLRLEGAVTDVGAEREMAVGSTFSIGLDLIRRVAIEASFPVGAIGRGTETTLLLAGPLNVGARLRLGGEVPTLFSARPQPRWALVLGAYVNLRMPHASGDDRYGKITEAAVSQPSAHTAIEVGWGPVQLVPSLSLLIEERSAYMQFGGRISLSIPKSLRFDLEAQSRIPVYLPEPRCGSGTRAGLGLRGALTKGVLGSAHYSVGSGDCEPTHRVTLALIFAFGDEPLRRIPTPEQVGIPGLWLGMVDPILDCNGWMLDDQTLLPKFKFGDPDPHDPSQIRRGEEVFRVGDHFDIDRYGRVYRPHQYVALADEQVFTEAKTLEKLALPVCAYGPRHRFFEYCRNFANNVEQLYEELRVVDEGHGLIAAQVRELQFEEECLSSEEKEDPRRMLIGLIGAWRMRPSAVGRSSQLPPTPPRSDRSVPGEPSNPSGSPSLGHSGTAQAKPSRMLGEKGTQFSSKTIWKGEGKERIDVENPSPGQRAGQIHFQDNKNKKYYYVPETNSFEGAPNSINDLLDDPRIKSAIQKGLRMLGEIP